MQTYRYSRAAVARICLREVTAHAGQVLPILLSYPVAKLIFEQNVQSLLFYLQTLPWLIVPAACYFWWRVWNLRRIQVQFDGAELVILSRHGRRGILSPETAAVLVSPRILHFITGRPDYTITLHAELDRFDTLRSDLLAWLPPNVRSVPASGGPGLLRSWGYFVSGIGTYTLAYGLNVAFPAASQTIFVITLALMFALPLGLLYRTARSPLQAHFDEPILPSYIVP